MVTLEKHISRQKMSVYLGEDSSTPLELAQEMISKIPLKVLRNTESRFLDPCAGTGTFLVILFDELKNYHSEEHILSNMLHACEVDKFKLRMLKNLGIENIYEESFLEKEFDMKFDVVIGNPPYNQDKSHHNSRGAVSMYVPFLHKVLDMKPVHILFVIPHTWMLLTNSNARELRNRLVSAGLKNVHHSPLGIFGKSVSVNTVILHTDRKHTGPFSYKRFYKSNGKIVDGDIVQIDPDQFQEFFPLAINSQTLESAKSLKYNSNSLVVKSGTVNVPRGFTGDTSGIDVYMNHNAGTVKVQQASTPSDIDTYRVAYAYLTGMEDPLCKETMVRDLKIVEPGTAISSKNRYILCKDAEEADKIYTYLKSSTAQDLLNCFARGSSLENWMIKSLPTQEEIDLIESTIG